MLNLAFSIYFLMQIPRTCTSKYAGKLHAKLYRNKLQFQINIVQFMPWQSLFVQLFHKRIGIKFLDIMYSRLAPQPFEEHHSTDHSRYTGSITYSLRTCFFISGFMATIVVYVIGSLIL